jgi:hypothetical protein
MVFWRLLAAVAWFKAFVGYLRHMPRAEILTTQAMHTLSQLHAELAGKLRQQIGSQTIDHSDEASRGRDEIAPA